MRSMCKLAAFASFVIFFSSSAFAATVTGTVKGPDGAPFEGAFVQAAGETFGPGDCPRPLAPMLPYTKIEWIFPEKTGPIHQS